MFALKFQEFEDMRNNVICYGSWSIQDDEMSSLPFLIKNMQVQNTTRQNIWSGTYHQQNILPTFLIRFHEMYIDVNAIPVSAKLSVNFSKWQNPPCFNTKFWLEQNKKGHRNSSIIVNVNMKKLFRHILPRTINSFIRTDLWLLLSKDDESFDEVEKKKLLK